MKKAQELLDKYWKGGLPINPEKVACLENITVLPNEGLSEKNLSGELIKNNDSLIIYYNPVDSIKRRRFTIAHELGHYLLGHGSNFHDSKNNFTMSHYDRREVEANQFAIELLIPKIAVEVLINQRKIYDVNELCRIFNVSLEAMSFRLKKLGFI